MPSWWGKSSSKDVKKKTRKENFVNTLHRFMSLAEQKEDARSERSRRCNMASAKGCQSRVESRSTSPSTQVSRCQSFGDRPDAQPLPLPRVHSDLPRIPSRPTGVSKRILEKRGKPLLFLPLPTDPQRLHAMEIDQELATASVSSNCSNDNDDLADSQIQSPAGIDSATGGKDVTQQTYRYFLLLR